jgi:hypothetical protein
MAAAENIHFIPPSASVGTAPQAAPQAPSNSDQTGFLAVLASFIMATIIAQVKNAGNESKANENQNELSRETLQLSQDQANKAKDDLKKYLDALEASKHQSWWQTLLGVLGAVFGTILAGLSGGLCSFLVAAAITVLMTVPVKDGKATFGELDDALKGLGLPDWATGLIKVGIIAAATLAGNAMGASAEIGLGALVNAAKASGTEVIEANAGAAAGAIEPEANAATEETFAQKFKDIGFNRAALTGTAIQLTFVMNPFIDFTAAGLKALGVSDKDAQLIASIVGTIEAILFALAGEGFAAGGSLTSKTANIQDMLNELGPKTYRYTYNAIDAVRGGLMAGSGAFGVLSGVSQLDGADALKKLGKAQAAQSIYQSLLKISNGVIQRDQESFKSVNQNFAMMNDTWQSYTEPYDIAARISLSNRN